MATPRETMADDGIEQPVEGLDQGGLRVDQEAAAATAAQPAADPGGGLAGAAPGAPAGDGENRIGDTKFRILLDLADKDVNAQANKVAKGMSEGDSTLDDAAEFSQSVLIGGVKPFFELYDFVSGGEPNYEDKTTFRRSLENYQVLLDRKSTVNAIASDVSQFVTSWIGVGKIVKAGRLLKGTQHAATAINASGQVVRATGQTSGRLARIAAETAKGATAGAFGFDPHEQRVSDLIETVPALANPITNYLASDIEDSAAEGMLKSAIEGIGLDVVVVSALALILKAAKLRRAGKVEEAEALDDKAAKLWGEGEEAAPPQPFGKSVGKMGTESEGTLIPAPLGEQSVIAPPIEGTGGEVAGKLTKGIGETTILEGPAPAPKPAADANIKTGFGTAQGSATITVNERTLAPWDVTVAEAKSARAGRASPEGAAASSAGKSRDAGDRSGGPNAAPGSTPSRTLAESTGIPREPSISETIPAGQAPTITAAKEGAGMAPQAARRPIMEFTDDEIAQAVKGADEDAAMLARYGSREAAELAGHSFAPMTVPWRKMAGTEDLAVFIQRVAEVKGQEFAKLKGGAILSDAKVLSQVQRYADVFGTDPDLTMGILQTAGREAGQLAARMEAGFTVSTKLFQAAYDLSGKLRQGMWREAGYASEEAALVDFKRLLGMAGETAAASRSLLSNAGRTVRRARFGLSADALKALDEMDPKLAVEAVFATRGDAKQMARAASPTFWRRAGKVFEHLIINGPLWWWPTHAVNFTTNLINLGLRPLEKTIGGALLAAAGRQGADTVLRRATLEYRYTVAAVGDGIKAAVDAFKAGDSILTPHEFLRGENITARALASLPKTIESVPDLVAYAQLATGIPTRVLGATDEMMKVIRYRAYVQAQAAEMAERMGLEGQAFKDHIRKALDDAFDADGHGLHVDALQEARAATFTDSLANPFTRWVQGGVTNVPALRAIMTYVRTPFKVLGYGIRMTPVLQMAHGDFRRAISGSRGVEAQAQALGQMALGGLAFLGAVMLASSGRVTGGGPNDAALRRELTKSGWKPYSIIIRNEDGSTTYLPIGRFDPIGLVFGMAADLVDIAQHTERYEEAQGLGLAVLVALAQNVRNRTFMTSLSAALDAFSEPDRTLGKWVGNVGEATLPFSALMRGLNPDPYLREARTMIDNLRDRLPGSSGMPALRDAWGDPITVYKGLWSSGEDDEVDREHQRLIGETGRGLTKIAASAGDAEVDLRDLTVTLEDGSTTTAFAWLQENMARPGGRIPPLKQALRGLIRSEQYGDLADGDTETTGTKLWAIARIRERYAAAARKRLLKEHPHVAAAVHRRKLEASEAWRQKQQERRRGGASETLDALGIRLNGE